MKEIDYKIIDKNIKNIQKTNEIILVVKNDAYGFNLKKILSIGLDNNINRYAVNTINEAIELRKLNNTISILLFGYQIDNIDLIKEYNIIPTISSPEELNIYSNNNIKCSLEIDIGMNRFGIKNIDESILLNPFIIEIYAHLYKDTNKNYKAINYITELGFKYNKLVHFGGSIAYKYTSYPLRLAHMIYDNCDSLIGQILYIKNIKKNETVGYDGKYKAKRNEIIGICNLGYYNGIKRNYKGRVFINGKYYQIVGKVCMNQIFILIDSNVQMGDIVTLFGKNMPKNEFLFNNSMSNYESFLLIR